MTSQKQQNRSWGFILVAFFGLAAVTISAFAMVYWLDPAVRNTERQGTWLLNAIPLVIFGIGVLGLLGRPLLSASLVGIGIFALYLVNGIKLENMGLPLMPDDLLLAGQVLDNPGFFLPYYNGSHKLAALSLLAGFAVAVLLFLAEGKWLRIPALPRGILLLLSLVFAFTLGKGAWFWREVYSDQALKGYTVWSPRTNPPRVGLIASQVRLQWEGQYGGVEADRNAVAEFARDHSRQIRERIDTVRPKELPDIVVVQSEAFFEPGILKGVESGQYTPNHHRLSQSGVSGELTVPAYGGGTIRTEFEFLTGYPMAAFPELMYPYYGLVQDWMPAVPRRLASEGYETVWLHPFSSFLWARSSAIPSLGFQKSIYEDGFRGAQRSGAYVSDEAVFNTVLNLLDKGTTPKYLMAVTMENHGPWKADPGNLRSLFEEYPLPAGLHGDGTRQMEDYLAHLINGDRALGAFAEKLLARPKWTVLVFYGDHLPSLKAAFEQLGFDDASMQANFEAGLKLDRSRYFILSNRPLPAAKLNLAAYELSGLLFDLVGLPQSGHLAITSAAREGRFTKRSNQLENHRAVMSSAILEVQCQHALSASGTCQ